MCARLTQSTYGCIEKSPRPIHLFLPLEKTTTTTTKTTPKKNKQTYIQTHQQINKLTNKQNPKQKQNEINNLFSGEQIITIFISIKTSTHKKHNNISKIDPIAYHS